MLVAFFLRAASDWSGGGASEAWGGRMRLHRPLQVQRSIPDAAFVGRLTRAVRRSSRDTRVISF
jgi:hypothetical protein